ncbi:MAG: ABC transporter permease [Burkholderiales bacterium]|nr:ABC transporter permease [Burkholderiales bacterium]
MQSNPRADLRAASIRRAFLRLGLAIVSAAIVFGVWELAARVFKLPVYLLPPPSLIFAELSQRLPRVLEHAQATTASMLMGYALGVVVAIPLAMALAYSRLFEAAVYPTVVFLQILPKIAIAPLFIIWFGFGTLPKVLLVFLLTFFPIVVSAVAGFKSCDPDIIELARSTGAGGLKIFLKVRFPSALPEIFTGLKVAAALASTAAVVAEFVSSDKGLGYLLLTFNGELLTSMVFGTIIVLGVIGLALYYIVEFTERLVIPWHVAARADEVALRAV